MSIDADARTAPLDPAPGHLRRALAALVITTLAYWTMNGAQLFETAVVVPAWSADVPESLALLRGEHAPDLQTFWIVVHSLHELTFLAAIALCWRLTAVRNALLALLVLHVALRVWTLAWFAPQIIGFSTDVPPAGPDLLARVALWRDLNLVRVGLYVAVSVALLPLVARVVRTRCLADRPTARMAL